MPSDASLAYKTYFTNRPHPGPYRAMHLLLMINITLRICKCLGTMGKWTIFQFKKKSFYFVARIRTRTIDMSGATFPSHQLPTAWEKSAIHWVGIKVETVAKKIKKKNKYTISMGLDKLY